MKQLLTILLLFPLFIACSSDDDDKKEEGLTDAQKEAFLVGQWSDSKSVVYYFGKDKSFQKYVFTSGFDKTTIRKSTDTGSSGTYSVEGNYIKVANKSTLFSIKDENTITIGIDFTRDDTEYTIIQ